MLAVAAFAMSSCQGESVPALNRIEEARRLATDLRVGFSHATDASNRAVMADTDEMSIAFAREAVHAKQTVQHDVDALVPLLRGLQYVEELRGLEEFGQDFAKYQALDRPILELVVENTNLKAQRLSFGPARAAADAVRKSLDAVVRKASPKSRCRIESLAAAATTAVREIQVLLAPHIAESSDAAMSGMEKEMAELEASARSTLSTLSGIVDAQSRAELSAAGAALDQFKSIHVQIIALSRRNSNVRSLELSLGEKRTLTVECERKLITLEGGLAKAYFTGTR